MCQKRNIIFTSKSIPARLPRCRSSSALRRRSVLHPSYLSADRPMRITPTSPVAEGSPTRNTRRRSMSQNRRRYATWSPLAETSPRQGGARGEGNLLCAQSQRTQTAQWAQRGQRAHNGKSGLTTKHSAKPDHREEKEDVNAACLARLQPSKQRSVSQPRHSVDFRNSSNNDPCLPHLPVGNDVSQRKWLPPPLRITKDPEIRPILSLTLCT